MTSKSSGYITSDSTLEIWIFFRPSRAIPIWLMAEWVSISDCSLVIAIFVIFLYTFLSLLLPLRLWKLMESKKKKRKIKETRWGKKYPYFMRLFARPWIFPFFKFWNAWPSFFLSLTRSFRNGFLLSLVSPFLLFSSLLLLLLPSFCFPLSSSRFSLPSVFLSRPLFPPLHLFSSLLLLFLPSFTFLFPCSSFSLSLIPPSLFFRSYFLFSFSLFSLPLFSYFSFPLSLPFPLFSIDHLLPHRW